MPTALCLFAASVLIWLAASSEACAGPTWVGAWSAAPEDTTRDVPAFVGGAFASTFADQTIRTIATLHAGGSEVRVHLSNRFGRSPVTFTSAQIAPRRSGASVVAAGRRVLTFGTKASVTIPPGKTVVSDPVSLEVRPLEPLAVSVHVADESAIDAHHHPIGTNYVTPRSSGDHTGDVTDGAFTRTTRSSLGVSAIDVLAPRPTGAIAVLGDSISDGLGSTSGGQRRWPDQLARRLLARPADEQLSVLNAGISGNQVATDNVRADVDTVRGAGPSGVSRLDPDALDQAGVTHLVVFIGINDIFVPSGSDPVRSIVAAYRTIIERARAAGVRVIGATLTPASAGPEREADRLAVNQWIRTSGAFDAVADFDAAMREPGQPGQLVPEFAADTVHLNDAGATALGDAFDLDLLRPGLCARR